jgi:hypothetical protein
MAKTLSDATAFAQAAASGQIGIDPSSARTVLSKIRTGKDHVEALIRSSAGLGAAPKLGANAVGTAIAAKFSDRAVGGGDSYEQALKNLHAQYDQVEKALVAAIQNYEEMEAASVDSFRRQM